MNLIELGEPVFEVASDASVADTARAMSARKSEVAAVVNEGRILGVVTDKDLMKRTADADRPALRVGDIMTAIESVDVSTPVVDAARSMRAGRMRHLALVDQEGTFVGIVGLRRVLFEVMDELDLKLDNLERELMADGPGG